MLQIDVQGRIVSSRVRVVISRSVERGAMARIRGIVVHQTGGASAQSTLNSYATPGANGAHFLIDRDGAIYQTASLAKRTNHVGKLRARCLAERHCSPWETAHLSKMKPSLRNRQEMRKQVPDRYPSNVDSVGIELVGRAYPIDEPDPDKRIYETVTDVQNAALAWLVRELCVTLGVPATEIFRHPVIAQKNATEARTAKW